MSSGDIRADEHWRIDGHTHRQRVTTAQLRRLLLRFEDTIYRHGDWAKLHKQSLGVGIYAIWFEVEKPCDQAN